MAQLPKMYDPNEGATPGGARFPTFEHALTPEMYFEAFAKAVPVNDALQEFAKSISLPPQMQAFSKITNMPDTVNGGVAQWPGIPPEAIRRISREHMLPQMIIGMRVDDVLRYSTLSTHIWKPGWRIVMRESGRSPSRDDLKEIREAESFLLNCGEGPLDARKRDSLQLTGFSQFLATAARESLTYDMMPIWTDMSVSGQVKAFKALPAPNMRLTPKGYNGDKSIFCVGVDDTNRVIQQFTRDDLFVHIRNPRADADVMGYGFPEIEMTVKVILAFTNAFEMNSSVFTASSIPNGLLTVEGMWTQRQLDVLSRVWQNLRKGITKAHALPVIPIPKDGKVTVLDLSTLKGNEAVYQDFQNMMAGIYCCIMRFPVTRIGYRMSGKGPDSTVDANTTAGTIIDEDDPGREPLLAGIQRAINEYIVWSRWPHLEMQFTGKNPKEDAREYEARSLAMTYGERRRAADLKPLSNGAGENADIADLMEMCPADPAMSGVWQALVAAKLGVKNGEDGKGPEAEFPSKKDPAASRDHGHEAGVRRDGGAEKKAAAKAEAALPPEVVEEDDE